MQLRSILYSRREGHIGHAIRVRRHTLGLTQTALAAMVGVRRNCIARHEALVSIAIDQPLVERLALALETTPEVLWRLAAAAEQSPTKKRAGRPKKVQSAP